MPSEFSLASISAYIAVTTLAVAIVALFIPKRGWNLLIAAVRKVRTTIRPSEGRCERLLWSDLPDGPLHVCSSPWPSRCHEQPHVKGSHCWERTLYAVINSRKRGRKARFEDKPATLPLSEKFVRVDFEVIFAYLVMMANIGTYHWSVQEFAETVDVKTISPGISLLHLRMPLDSKRRFTKGYIELLLHGYPPLVEDPRGTSILKHGDERRGGWVVALGLDERSILSPRPDFFLPWYSDNVRYVNPKYGKRRGRVFWRSMDRVQRILTDVVYPAFNESQHAEHINKTLRALDNIQVANQQSTREASLVVRELELHFCRTLLPHEKTKIIGLFNGSPHIGPNQMPSFRDEWTDLLPYILIAALKGSRICMRYLRLNRDLDSISLADDLKQADIYIRGCYLSSKGRIQELV